MSNIKFKLNKKAFQDVVLYGIGDAAVRSAAGSGPDVEVDRSSNSRGGGRARARIYGGSVDAEAKGGGLARRLGGMHL